MPVENLSGFIEAVQEHLGDWTGPKLGSVQGAASNRFPERPDLDELAQVAWFRGQGSPWTLIPRLYQNKHFTRLSESKMNIECLTMGARFMKDKKELPSWLCLMQHHGLPTRLLDWSESAAVALYFAVEQGDQFRRWDRWEDSFNPIVWGLNPHAMNWVATGGSPIPIASAAYAAGNPKDGYTELWGLKNIYAAFDAYGVEDDLPNAIMPEYVHDRLQTQKSRFTAHGKRRLGIEKSFIDTDLVRLGFLFSIEIEKHAADKIIVELRRFGISRSTLFPDLDGLGIELGMRLSHP